MKPRTLLRMLALFILALLIVQTLLLLSNESIVGSSSSTPTTLGRDVVVGGGARTGGEAVVFPHHRTAPFDGNATTTFTPHEFLAGRREDYVNLPLHPADGEDPDRRDDEVRRLTMEYVPPPSEELMHVSPIPPGRNAILGLASYPTFAIGWRRLLGSLRNAGYDGHVIMGVNPNLPDEERDYLDRMGVTYYAVEVVDCDPSILDERVAEGGKEEGTKNAVRARCSVGLEDLKLEWGRYEMARRWLRACESCTGWSMVIDTRDVFFQSDPFAVLMEEYTRHDLLFVEEIANHTNTLPSGGPQRATNLGRSNRFVHHTVPCYGKDVVRAYELTDRPMLCSGTVIGTRDGMHRFLSVLVDEFRRNNRSGKPECRSPHTTDQWTMNHMYYRGKFGSVSTTRTLPWGTGPVLTVGTPCVDQRIEDVRARIGRKDMIVFDPHTGLILNPHEEDGSPARIAPILHQYDRCGKWMRDWFEEHRSLFNAGGGVRLEDEPAVAWVRAAMNVSSER
ncbi:hypothetical protein ACHAXA_009946 [Cyclostephanos tholiformis]|uniref:Uncharacterized protein n=1 Tax=Cyclostephanos tholiformis TaxID=382380 RepID=A0ABD3RY08_9STRA